MVAKRSFAVGLASLLVLCVAACSSGDGKQSARTTTETASTTTIPPGVDGNLSTAARFAGNLGPCPLTPDYRLTGLPSVVDSLRGTLVPINALKARVCEYGDVPVRLERSARLVVPATVKSLVDAANRLQRSTDATCDQPDGAPFYVVTFANNTVEINVVSGPCGSVTNFVCEVRTTKKWLNVLHRYSTPSSLAQAAATGPSNPTGRA